MKILHKRINICPFIIIFTVLCIISCNRTDRAADKQFHAAEAVMNSHPDSALRIMQGIDTAGLSQSRLAHYALLLTKAMDKNYIPLTNDTLIRKAVNYMSGRGDSLETQALYYYGEILCRLNRKDEALAFLHMAEDLAKDRQDYFYAALCERALSEEYRHLYIFHKAKEFGLAAKENFLKSGRREHAKWMDTIIIDFFTDNGNPEAALEYGDKVDTFLYNNNSTFRHSIIKSKADAYMQLEKYPDAIRQYEYLINDNYQMNALNWCKLSESYFFNGNIDLSEEARDSALLYSKTKQDTLYLGMLNSLLLRQAGLYEQAAESAYNWGKNIMDYDGNKLAFPKTLLVTQYYQIAHKNKKIESDRATERFIWVSMTGVLLILILIMAILFLRGRINARNITIQNLIESYQGLMSDLEKYKELGFESNAQLKDLIGNKLKMLDEICVKWYEYGGNIKDMEKLPKSVKSVFDRLSRETEIDNIGSLIDIYSGGWMECFMKTFPDLRPTHIELARYLYAGFSNEAIVVLMKKKTLNAVRQEKHRLKKAIEEANAGDIENIYKVLGI